MLLLAGDDTAHRLTQELREIAAAIGGRRRVQLLPNITSREKRLLLSSADVFLAISDTVEETFGISVVEAMMAGLPVVASEWDGYRYLVDHGRDGFLLPTYLQSELTELCAISALVDTRAALGQRAFSDWRRLREILRFLAQNESAGRAMGSAGRKKALERFTWKQMLKVYEQLWAEQLLAARNVSPRVAQTKGQVPVFVDYSRVFAHYPTTLISDETALVANSNAAHMYEQLASGRIGSSNRMNSELDRSLLNRCCTRAITLGELIREFESDAVTRATIIGRISWLLKFGLFELQAVESKAGHAPTSG